MKIWLRDMLEEPSFQKWRVAKYRTCRQSRLREKGTHVQCNSENWGELCKKRGTREREGTTDCGQWERTMMQRALQTLRCYESQGSRSRALSENAGTWEKGSTLVATPCHLWPPYQFPSGAPPPLAPFPLPVISTYVWRSKSLDLRSRQCFVGDESQGADFFGLFLAAMKDASVEFWEVWGEGTGNREGSRASFSAAAVTNTDTVKLLLGNSILSAWAFILTLELQEKWK